MASEALPSAVDRRWLSFDRHIRVFLRHTEFLRSTAIDHAVGLEFHKCIGDRVEKGETLITIHYNSDAKLPEAKS